MSDTQVSLSKAIHIKCGHESNAANDDSEMRLWEKWKKKRDEEEGMNEEKKEKKKN